MGIHSEIGQRYLIPNRLFLDEEVASVFEGRSHGPVALPGLPAKLPLRIENRCQLFLTSSPTFPFFLFG